VGLLRIRSRVVVAVLVSAAMVPLLGSELLYWRAASNAGRIPATGSGAVVVLGLPGTNAATRAVQRWRVELGVRAWRECGCERVVFTGTATRGRVSESSEMAQIARKLGLPAEAVLLDEKSRSTWENVEQAATLVGNGDYVIVASDALHATRARAYWHEQHPEGAPKVLLADRYSPLDHFWLRLPAMLGELLHRARR
jgi:uncharacterized SAM-binding protein YcdF (DUF218 family)